MAQSQRRRRADLRAIIYTRQSMFREESISLEDQERAGREYAASRGYTVTNVISDPGISGLQLSKRPGIRRAIEVIEAGDADVLLVWRWSRLSRRRPHQAVIIDRIEQAGGRVESALEPVDTTTAGGRFSREVLLATAVFESETKSEQWKDAQARRIRMGMPGGGPVPVGYTRATGRDEPYRPDPVMGPVVHQMYADYLAGQGPQRIAKGLNDRGMKTGRGKVFSVATVTRILDSGFAAGYFTANGEMIQGTHEAVIDQQTWQAYQRERERRRQTPTKSRQPRWFLGGGLTVCGRCGGNLIVNSYVGKSLAICGRYKTQRSCDGVWIKRAPLEVFVAMWMGTRLDEWADRAEEMHGIDEERDQLVKQLDQERAVEDKIRTGLVGLQSLVGSGDVTPDEYRNARRDADDKLRDAAAGVTEIETRLDALNPDGDVYERLGAIYTIPEGVGIEAAMDQTPTDAERMEWNALLRKIIRRVIVGPETITIEPWRGEPHIRDRAVVAPRSPRRGGQARSVDGRFTRD